MRRMAAGALAMLLWACAGDVTEPEDPVVGLVAPDSVLVDAVRELVTLRAELVFASGGREPARGVEWSGCEGGVGELSPDGTLITRGEGECGVEAAWGDLRAVVRVVVRPRGVLTLTFDDGWKSARTVALPVLAAEGLVGNVAVLPGTVGWPAYLTVADMRELDAAGWSFVSHTVHHDSLPSVPDDSLEWAIREPVRWLVDHDLRTADVLIVPYHEWGQRERTAVRGSFAAARGNTVDVFWPEYIAEWRPEDPYRITAIDALDLSRSAEGRARAMDYVERAVEGGFILDLQFHDIRPEDEAGFRALIGELARHADRVRTWSELYPLDGS